MSCNRQSPPPNILVSCITQSLMHPLNPEPIHWTSQPTCRAPSYAPLSNPILKLAVTNHHPWPDYYSGLPSATWQSQ